MAGVLASALFCHIRVAAERIGDIGDRPLLMLAMLLVILGVQMISIGLVAEMITRTYHESQQKTTYTIREWLHDAEPAAVHNGNGKLAHESLTPEL